MDGSAAVNSEAEYERQVRALLRPGESFRAAVWVSRPAERSPAGLTRAEMSPFRFRRPAPEARRYVQGPPRSRAAGLDEHIRIVTDPRLLARTDRRLLVLAKGFGSWRDVFRPAARRPLLLRWECSRAELASVAEQAGRLTLAFTDGSAVTLLTPAARVQPFLAG